MELKTLSCAIARVIIHYHAHRTETEALSVHDLLDLLSNSEDVWHENLKKKIEEATTNNNSSRLTFLQYMLFGLTLSEKARKPEHLENIEVIKSQLIQFIQNLQRLLTTAGFLTRELTFPTLPEQSLSVFLLDHSTSTAYQLTQQLFQEIQLSPNTTNTSIQEAIEELCLIQANQTLIRQNTHLKCQLDSFNQTIASLEHKLALLQGKSQASHEHAISIDFTDDDSDGNDDMNDWESISQADLDTRLKNNQLQTLQTQLLNKHETASKKIHIFENLIAVLEKKQTKKTQITRNITSSHPHVSQYCSMIGIFAAALANTLGDEDTCADIANIKKIN